MTINSASLTGIIDTHMHIYGPQAVFSGESPLREGVPARPIS